MDIYANTIEHAKLVVQADRVLGDNEVVQVAELHWHAFPDADTPWVAAQWIGTPGSRRVCQVLVVGRDVTSVPTGALRVANRGKRRMWLQLPSATPERIIRQSSGMLTVH